MFLSMLMACGADLKSTTGTRGTGMDPSGGFDDPYGSGGNGAAGGDATSGAGSSSGVPLDDGGILVVGCRSARVDEAVLSSNLSDALGEVTASVTGEPCARSFQLKSTAKQRDEAAPSERSLTDREDGPSLSTNHPMFDGLYALALEESRENSVAQIQDGSFGAALACPEGGCFQTGQLWTYVWTRDTSYAMDLGLAALDPKRAQNSLLFKLSELRSGGQEQIVQDTGSGGSYPISSDRVVWALGAQRLLPYLEPADALSFGARAYTALKNTLEHDRKVVFDSELGLYRGEQSFLDWREQSYPRWVASDVVHLGMSYALSTNVLHLAALSVTASLARAQGDGDGAARYAAWAEALRSSIAQRFWLEEDQQFLSFLTTALDPAPVRRFDALGTALAVLWDVGSAAQQKAAIASYPLLPHGAPVIWPQQQDTPIYHNRAIWPFVSAYLAQAARKVESDAGVAHALKSMVRGAALNLSNMENLEVVSGAPSVSDGPNSGPVVNSRRQLWSVAGYLAAVHHVLFGIEVSNAGLRVKPFVPHSLQSEWFPKSQTLVLNQFPWRGKSITVELSLPKAQAGTGALKVGSTRLNGRPVEGTIAYGELASENLIQVELVAEASPAQKVRLVEDVADFRKLFGPRAPIVSDAKTMGNAIQLTLALDNELPGNVRMALYRDGVRIASDLPGSTTTYLDSGASSTGPTPCYSAELCYVGTKNCSQHAAPRCYWGDSYERIQTRFPSDLTVSGGVRSATNGRDHIGGWGGPNDELSATFTAARSGTHRVQLTFANGAGPINTGITCGVKRVDVLLGASLVESGYVLFPHTGSASEWRGSSFLKVQLEAGKSYKVVVKGDEHSGNMSRFAHFERYTGQGGSSGTYERVDIAELKLLGP